MLTYEATVSITAPRERVWHVLSNVAEWPEWLRTVDSVVPLDERSIRLGSRYVVHQPRLRPATWIVSKLEPSRRFTWEARSPGIRMVAEHTITAGSPTASTVRLRFSFAGLFGGMIGRRFRSVTESYLAQEAGSLKRKVEAGNIDQSSWRRNGDAVARHDHRLI